MSLSSATARASGSDPVYGMPSISQTAGTRASRERLTPGPLGEVEHEVRRVVEDGFEERPAVAQFDDRRGRAPRSTSAMALTVTGESNSSCRSSGAPAGSGSSGFRVKAMPIRIR